MPAFRFRLVPFIAALVVACAGLALGEWQRGRALQKEELAALQVVRMQEPPLILDKGSLPAGELEYRRVIAHGEFLRDWPVYLENRPLGSRSGFLLLMPLRLAGSNEVVLVLRGWLPRDPTDRARVPSVSTPPGKVTVEGRIRHDAGHVMQLGQAATIAPGAIVQNLQPAGFATASGMNTLPFIIEQAPEPASAAASPLVRQWTQPDSGADRNRGYAFQWYALALTALLFFIVTGFGVVEVERVEPRARGMWNLWAVIAICAAPMLLSYLTYYVIKPQTRTNYGTLIDPRQYPIPPLAGRSLDGKPVDLDAFKGKWIMLQVDSGACAAYCQKKLWEMRQLRLTQGKEMGRIERVWLLDDQLPPEQSLLRDYEGTHLIRVNAQALRNWLPEDTGGVEEDHIYIIDPLGNLMMRFPRDADPNRMKRDIARLLKASAIG